jgi:hypothetical protein
LECNDDLTIVIQTNWATYAKTLKGTWDGAWLDIYIQ